ncbi:MAG: DUF454 domain-containing protein [Anaerolineales bacterium]|nr:MAG: DUF454 domain-containing protein [Anaerolineales bacterium]
MVKPPLHKGLLISVGVLSVGLATAGIFLPLLPTTPFLLLAAACFIRSSDRLYRWLITHKWFGPYIKNYWEHKAITKRAKVVILLLLWGTLGYTAIGVISALAARVLLLLIGVGVTLHVLSLKTLTPEMLSEKRRTEGVEGETSQGAAVHNC